MYIDFNEFDEYKIISHLIPDGIFYMDTALVHYNYTDRIPQEFHIAVDRNSNKTRFNIQYPRIKPYYIKNDYLNIGLTSDNINGNMVRIYDKERIICDVIRRRNKMDIELFRMAIISYISDPTKNINKLMEYAKILRIYNKVDEIVGLWL